MFNFGNTGEDSQLKKIYLSLWLLQASQAQALSSNGQWISWVGGGCATGITSGIAIAAMNDSEEEKADYLKTAAVYGLSGCIIGSVIGFFTVNSDNEVETLKDEIKSYKDINENLRKQVSNLQRQTPNAVKNFNEINLSVFKDAPRTKNHKLKEGRIPFNSNCSNQNTYSFFIDRDSLAKKYRLSSLTTWQDIPEIVVSPYLSMQIRLRTPQTECALFKPNLISKTYLGDILPTFQETLYQMIYDTMLSKEKKD